MDSKVKVREVTVISPSSKEINCFQTICEYAWYGCKDKDEGDRIILRKCINIVGELLVKDALNKGEK